MSSIIDFFQSINFTGWQQNIKVVFAVMTLVMLGLAIYSYIKAHLLIQQHRMHELEHGYGHAAEHGGHAETPHERPVPHPGEHEVLENGDVYAEPWERIRRSANSIREADWKLAVIEADKLVDTALQSKGFAGETMGERLMLIQPSQLNSLQNLWDAHKLRNLLVHETRYELKHDQALAAINAFERVLRELGVLS